MTTRRASRPRPKRRLGMPDDEAVEFARAVGVHRVFRNARDETAWGRRCWTAALPLQRLLLQAQDGDKDAERKWIKACGLGRGRRVSRGRDQRWVRAQVVRILNAPNPAERKARVEHLLEYLGERDGGTDLSSVLAAVHGRLCDYDLGRPRKPLAPALGSAVGEILVREISKNECYVLLDLVLDITKVYPRRGRAPDRLGERIRKWVA